MRILGLAICCSILLLFSGTCATAQANEYPSQCGDMSAQLDAFATKAGQEDTLIAIARLGADEDDLGLNRRRLYNLKTYLTKYRYRSVFANNPDNVILASGEKTEGLATLSIYLKGQLVSIFHLASNRDLFVGECVFDTEKYKNICEVDEQKMFYPCLDNACESFGLQSTVFGRSQEIRGSKKSFTLPF